MQDQHIKILQVKYAILQCNSFKNLNAINDVLTSTHPFWNLKPQISTSTNPHQS